MAKKNHNTKVVEQTTQVAAQENTMGMTIEEAALSLVQQFELECAAAKAKQKGQSLPMGDIVEGVVMLMTAAKATRASVSVLAEKVPKLLAVKYAAMGNSTNLVAVRVGHQIKEMPNDELRALREKQLAHMLHKDTKDNFYRRIYNIGFSKKTTTTGDVFELDNGDLVRKRITEGNTPQA